MFSNNLTRQQSVPIDTVRMLYTDLRIGLVAPLRVTGSSIRGAIDLAKADLCFHEKIRDQNSILNQAVRASYNLTLHLFSRDNELSILVSYFYTFRLFTNEGT